MPDPVAAGVVDELGSGAGSSAPRLDALATVLRGAILDHWVREFLTAHPAGTVVELGAGLNTRAERLTAEDDPATPPSAAGAPDADADTPTPWADAHWVDRKSVV